ncbi:MAG: hypothetical protein PHU51_02565 [Candidatus Nanoarchaeia archaeon]|nr:hypothetical protein [Candidatus Nanoarchaeia archaeon]
MNFIKPIQTTNKSIRIEGKVFYNDRRRRIDVKRPIRDLFDANQDVRYVMELCLSKDKLATRIQELENKGVTPLLLYFIGDDKDDA